MDKANVGPVLTEWGVTLKMKWTVARFPNGSWSTGGSPDDPDLAECEIFIVEADSPEKAKKKAQAKRARDRRSAATKVGRLRALRRHRSMPEWKFQSREHRNLFLVGLMAILLLCAPILPLSVPLLWVVVGWLVGPFKFQAADPTGRGYPYPIWFCMVGGWPYAIFLKHQGRL